MKKFILSLCGFMLVSCSVAIATAEERCNFAPTAKITNTTNTYGWVFTSGKPITFSGSTSTPNNCNGDITQYRWLVEGVYTYSQNKGHTFTLGSGVYEQTYQVELRVRNDIGLYHTTTITVTVKKPKRVYHLRDHLGSVRTSVDENETIVGYDDYYPFGLTMPGRSSNTGNPNDNYKFTGYEQDDEAGLNLYHANARGYDPILGRFGQIDPMMEFASPYVYVGNNPLRLTDPTGMSTDIEKELEKEAEEERRKIMEARADRRWAERTGLNSWTGSSIERVPTEGEAGGGCPDCQESGGEELTDVTEKFNAQLEETRRFFKELSSYVDELDISKRRKHAVKLLLFRNYTKSNSKFDIKQPGKGFSPEELGGDYALYRGEKFRYDDFGNYNFGVAALAFGIPLDHALMGAGINQLKPGGGKPDFGNWKGTFDDKQDTEMIIRGYYHAFY